MSHSVVALSRQLEACVLNALAGHKESRGEAVKLCLAVVTHGGRCRVDRSIASKFDGDDFRQQVALGVEQTWHRFRGHSVGEFYCLVRSVAYRTRCAAEGQYMPECRCSAELEARRRRAGAAVLEELLTSEEPSPEAVAEAHERESYAWDLDNNVTSITDSVSNKTTLAYDHLNRETSESNQLGYSRTYVYNAASQLTQSTDRDGRVINYTFDNLGRETAEQWMNGSTAVNTIAAAYDAANQLTSIGDSFSNYAYAYDGQGNVTSVDNSGTPNIPHVVLASQYDTLGNRTQLSATVAGTADFKNSYTYDNLSRLISATQQGQTGGNGVASKGVGYAYDSLGDMTSISRITDLVDHPAPVVAGSTLTYSTAGLLTSDNQSHNSTTIDNLSLTYDTANRVGTLTTIDGTATYDYDHDSQVTSATYTGTNQPANESYTFDANGNRTNTGYTTGTNNQLTSDGTFNYAYDHEGNLVTRTRIASGQANDYKTTYTWDYRSRLTDVNYDNNSNTLTKHVHYVYDVWNNLIGKQVDDTGGGSYNRSEWYAVDVSDPAQQGTGDALPVLQFDGNGHETYRYLNAPGADGVEQVQAEEDLNPSSPGTAGSVYFYLADPQGTLRDVVDANGNLVDHLTYNSFGQAAYESSSTTHHWEAFAGGHIDPDTGLVQLGARWYNPTAGRWISEDPAGFAAGDANLNRYVGNGATNSVDPSGLTSINANGGISINLGNALSNLGVGVNLASPDDAPYWVDPASVIIQVSVVNVPAPPGNTLASGVPAVGQAIAAAGAGSMPSTGGQPPGGSPVGSPPAGGPSSTGNPSAVSGGGLRSILGLNNGPGSGGMNGPGGTLRAGGGISRGTQGMQQFGNSVNKAVVVATAAASGAGDGGAMVGNAVTFGLTPLDDYVTQTIELNGGSYKYANFSAQLSASILSMLVPCGRVATAIKGIGVMSGANTLWQGVQSGNWWQAGMGVLGMIPLFGSWCFVGGTQVVMADSGEDVPASQLEVAATSGVATAEDGRWLWSLLVVGVGIAGYRAARQINRREEEEALERAATRKLFQDLEDDDITGEGTAPRLSDPECPMVCAEAIDDLCDALFHGASLSDDPRVRVRAARPVPEASTVGAVFAEATRRRLVAASSKSLQHDVGHIAANQGGKRRSRSWLGIAWLAACLLFAMCLGFSPRSDSPRSLATSTDLPGSFAHVPGDSLYVTKSIEEISVGDQVQSWDPTTGVVAAKRVDKVFVRVADHLRVLWLDSPDGQSQEIRTTDDHPFWDARLQRFVCARELGERDLVVGPNGESQIVAANIREEHPEGVTVYNFRVEDSHTYFVSERVGQIPILVHNANYRASGNPNIARLTPLAGTRGTGVARAVKAEVELVRQTGQGTIQGGWTPAEVEFIQQTGRLPPGTVGHHINNVADFPDWAGDPRNIKFVRGQPANLAEHGGNFQNSTTGPLIDR
jgi:RHS repeat-associated protein